MKKLIIILSIAAFALVSKSEAQGLFYSSYGTQQLWGMPPEVQWVLDRNYYNFHMVHTNRFWDRGRLYFDVVLQRGGVFVDVRIDSRGFVYNTFYRNNYPFHNHVCSGFCGFHRDYYWSYRVAVGHPRYYKYNHVYYRPNVVIVNHDHIHHHGNNNKTYKQYRPANTQNSYRVDRTDNGRIERINDRGRDYRPGPRSDGRGNSNGNYGNNNGNNGVRDHGVGVGRGNGNGQGNGGNVGNKGNNGVRDHGVGVGRGNGQNKGQGYGNGNGNSGRVFTPSNSRTSSAPRAVANNSRSSVSYNSGRTSSPSRSSVSSNSSRTSASRTAVSPSSGRSSRSDNSSGSGRTSTGRSVRTR